MDNRKMKNTICEMFKQLRRKTAMQQVLDALLQKENEPQKGLKMVFRE